ncbi:MAG: DEAD/DEAH box helicase, partial [Acidobacteriota bacterium]|nr:DEAD/DEAH box helicase [Acidobacteriota bacterium]
TSNNRNLVVASGTGSGKTEYFLLPIINDLLSDPTPGVRALLIYPMNALVNDQLTRLRELLRGTNITFGRYTSELKERETDGRNNSPDSPINEIVSREAMRGGAGQSSEPPQILITNYAMLEYLLLRPKDSPLFDSGAWRFVCLDEAHTYTGAQGIEVSMLLRRLKHRLNKQRGQMRCIATSATLIKDDATAAANFAGQLFGETFTADDVIFGETLNLAAGHTDADWFPPISAYGQSLDDMRLQLRDASAKGGDNDANNQTLIEQAAKLFLESGLASASQVDFAQRESSGNDITRFLWAALKSNSHLVQLRELMREHPIELREAGRRLFESEDNEGYASELSETKTDAALRLIELGALARESKESAPLLPARYHLFARGPQGAWLCLDPQHAAQNARTGWASLFLEKRERCEECDAAVFELTACRNCGQPFVRAFERDGFFYAEGRHPADTGGQRYFTWRQLSAESDGEGEEIEAEDAVSISAQAMEVCLGCRRRFIACVCQSKPRRISLYPVINKKGQPYEKLMECPCCSTSSNQREVVTPITVGSRAPLAVLTEDLYHLIPPASDAEAKHKPGEGRKLLAFNDTRQGAARYAAYLQGTSDESLHRHLIVAAADSLNAAERVPDMEELAERCVALAE